MDEFENDRIQVRKNKTDDNAVLQRTGLILDPLSEQEKEQVGIKSREVEKADNAKMRLEAFEKEIETDKKTFLALHTVKNHSLRFLNMVVVTRRSIGNDMHINDLVHVPEQNELCAKFGHEFKDTLAPEVRRDKKKNKRSRLFQKERNADVMDICVAKYESRQERMMDRLLETMKRPCEKEDYHDLSCFLEEGNEEENKRLLRMYLGVSDNKGPGGFAGQDVQGALDMMAKQLFSVDIRTINLENDAEIAKHAGELEHLADRVAAFDRLCEKHNFMDSLRIDEQKLLNDKLTPLRSLCAYYNIRKEIMHDTCYKDHYNEELSMDVTKAETDEQKALAEKLVRSFALAKSMMRQNRVDEKDMDKYRVPEFRDEAMRGMFDNILVEYEKAEKQKAIGTQSYLQRTAKREALKVRKKNEWQGIENSMDRVLDKAFIPVKRPSFRTGFWYKFKNRFMLGARWLWGISVGTVATVIGNAISAPEKLFTESERRKNAQETRRHDMVPGREGEFFEDYKTEYDRNGEEQVYSDYRRGPLVWEKITAGDPEEPPEMCILVEQAKKGSAMASEGKANNEGHAMIGLSYSRYNKTTGRKERYQLRFGFYPKLEVTGAAGTLMMAAGAVVPGRLVDDKNHSYDIGRRYQVTNGDINRILRAAETYADKGYNMWKRNCSTFVMEMAKAANLPIAEKVKEDEFRIATKNDLLLAIGNGMSYAGFLGGANVISSRMNQRELSYQNFGQKLFTKEELDRYYKSAFNTDFLKKGYAPGPLGEEIRYDNDGNVVALGAENEHDGSVGALIIRAGSSLWDSIAKLVPEDQRGPEEEMLKEALMLKGDGGMNSYMSSKTVKSTTENMRRAHKEVSWAMRVVNKYYKEKLGQDARLNAQVLEFLGKCEAALTLINMHYNDLLVRDVRGEAGALRYAFTERNYKVKFTDKDKKVYEADVEPGVYEGYLLMGEKPEEAVKQTARYRELYEIEDKDMTSAQKKEFARLKVKRTLAEDFAHANRYILEKETVDEKDIKYAFTTLPAKERKVEKGEYLSGALFDFGRPSATYQAVIFEKVFPGVRACTLDRREKVKEQVEILDTFMTECVKLNPELMRMILKELVTNGTEKDASMVCYEFMADFANGYLAAAYGGGIDAFRMSAALPSKLFMGTNIAAWIKNEINEIRKEQGGIEN